MNILDWLKKYGDIENGAISFRVVGRVLHELQNMKSDSIDLYYQISEKLTKYQQSINSLVQKQIDSITEIQNEFRGIDKPIFIKGISAAALCNRNDFIRYSGDIDLFFSDIKSLKDVLLRLGYSELKETPAPHEDSFFQRGDVFIEIHKYFPVLQEPNKPVECFKDKLQLNMPNIVINKLEYTALFHHSKSVSNDVVKNLVIVNPAMTVFSLCCHTYKDLFWQPYKTIRVRIAELLEICDILALTDFNLAEFTEIVKQFNAVHIVNYVFSLIESSLSVKLPIPFTFVNNPIVKLANDAYSPYRLSDSLYFETLPFASFQQTLIETGCYPCEVGKWLSSKDTGVSYYASSSEQIIDFDFRIESNKKRICFEVHLPRTVIDGDNICILLDDDVYSHIWYDCYPEKIREYGSMQYSTDVSSRGYTLKFYTEVPESFPMYAVLSVGNFSENMQTITVLPIEIKN